MSDLVRADPQVFVSGFRSNGQRMSEYSRYEQGSRVFNGPDGLQYRWRPSPTNADILVGPNTFAMSACRS